ncbi:MAG TPA: four helix bundle protein [Terracidiphilus sp.]|jgi:four helix bundle protein
MSRTRHYRDLTAWQKAMELARIVYIRTESFPKSETFGLCMQMRRSAVNVATMISGAHGRLNDGEMRKGLGGARAAINELQTRAELAGCLGFLDGATTEECLDLATRVAKLINGLLGVLEPSEGSQETREPANSPRAERANPRRDEFQQ